MSATSVRRLEVIAIVVIAVLFIVILGPAIILIMINLNV